MIQILITDENGKLRETDTIEKGSWIHLINPDQDEINYIIDELNLDPDFIKDPLDDEERSRIEKEDDNSLIIVDIPIVSHDKDGKSIYDTIPLGMIVTKECFITICLEENPIFDRFILNRVKEFYTFKKTRFALQLLYTISTYYLRYLKQINRKTNEIESALHRSMKNEELFYLLSLEKSLVYFTTSLKANNIVMQKMLKSEYLRMYEDDQDLLEDVIIEYRQAIEMAETYSNILNGMMDVFASLISNNLNAVMKLLTSITIILSLPTMVASFFGMNVRIPFENDPHGFFTVMIIAFVLSTTAAIIFWKRKYL
jgi:magnesium transporter